MMFPCINNIYRIKKIINVKSKRLCNYFFSEPFIFNFENLESLKKIKQPTVNDSSSQKINQDKHIEEYEERLKNYSCTTTNSSSDNIKGYNNFIDDYSNFDKDALKKTRKVYNIVERKLRKFENTPLNKYFYIFYKNEKYLSELEIIHIVYLALKNRKYHLLDKDDQININSHTDIIFNKEQLNKTPNHNNIEDISYNIDVSSYNIKESKVEYYDKNKVCEKYNSYDNNILEAYDTGNVSYEENIKNDIPNNLNNIKEIKTKELYTTNHDNNNNNYYYYNIKIEEKGENDYVYKLLYTLNNKLKLYQNYIINFTIKDIYKLSYCQHYYNLYNNKFIPLYLCAFLKREINYIKQNKNIYEIKDHNQLDFLLNLLILEKKNLNTYFIQILYDYLFNIIKKENLFSITCKHVCLLLNINRFESTKYDMFFFLHMERDKDIMRKLSLKDINYLLYYQLKNEINIVKNVDTTNNTENLNDTYNYNNNNNICNYNNNNFYCMKWLSLFFGTIINKCTHMNNSEINLEMIQNIHLFSQILLHYDYSKQYSNIYDTYLELIYNVYSYINLKVNNFVQNIKNNNFNINFFITLSLALSVIKNNININDNFYVFLFYLINDKKIKHMDVNHWIYILYFIHFCNFKRNIYYKQNILYKKDIMKVIYICDNNHVGHMNTYIPFDDNFMYSYIMDKLKNIYSYHEKGTNDIYIFKDLKQNYSYNITNNHKHVQEDNLSIDKENGKKKMDIYHTKKAIIIDEYNNICSNTHNICNDKKLSMIEHNKEKINQPHVVHMNIQQHDNIYLKEENIKIICDQKKNNIDNNIINKNYDNNINVHNKSYYMNILDILILLKHKKKDNNFYKHLLLLFNKNIFKYYNIHIFHIDKILVTFSQLNINKSHISLNIFNLLENIKNNIIHNNNYIKQEHYFYHSLSNILLSLVELNMLKIIDLNIFEKNILNNLNNMNINSLLVLIQYYILKGNTCCNNINIIIILLLNYITKKYTSLHKQQPYEEINKKNAQNIYLDWYDIKNDKHYDIIKTYLLKNDEENCNEEKNKRDVLYKHTKNYNETIKDINKKNTDQYQTNNLYEDLINPYNFHFHKIDQDDFYEYLLLRFVFINIFTHSNIIQENIKYHMKEYEPRILNNFNKMIWHLKNNFEGIININLYTEEERNKKIMEYDKSEYLRISHSNIQNQHMLNTTKKENIHNNKHINNDSINIYKDVTTYSDYDQIKEHYIYNDKHYYKNNNNNNNNNILSKKNFFLILNYFLYIFNHNLNILIKEKNLLECILLQLVHVKKFKNTYYNYKYLFLYRKLILSLIYDMEKKQKTKMNYLLNPEVYEEQKKKTLDIQQTEYHKCINIIRHFNYICEKNKKNKIQKNIFYNYLQKYNFLHIYNDEQYKNYKILDNEHILYNLNSDILNIYINAPLFNYIIPIVIQTKNKSLAIHYIWNNEENLDTYMVLYNIMKTFLISYNYDIILIKTSDMNNVNISNKCQEISS
ncbi:hypothetical protein PGSY75_0705200 [Plasmodium gaboni]|uniref:Uncharacterized protein n=1 Tax=Plasmodium gaboni TaxID=647221 RepID=A0A151LPW1_9APIC|nr:hypothetical protein PGSY75_0705200 [Plasmodium gaboni]KYO01218.1 hypothetical protein PGSY75_0705200 [Plasmodium gaboni]